MRKNDQEVGQLALDFAPSSASRVKPDPHAGRRQLFTLLISPQKNGEACSSIGGQKGARPMHDVYAPEVTRAIHAFADRLGW